MSEQRFQQLYDSQNQSNFSGILCNYGFALFQQGKNDEAMIKFDEALKQDPSLVQAYIMKGQVLRSTQQFSKALNCYQIDINNIHDDKQRHHIYMKKDLLYSIKQSSRSYKIV